MEEVLKEFPLRPPQANPHNYTELELAKREKAIKDMGRDHPTIPPKWLEWLYDIVENKPQEEIEDIINNNKWSKKLVDRPFDRAYQTTEVIEPGTEEWERLMERKRLAEIEEAKKQEEVKERELKKLELDE